MNFSANSIQQKKFSPVHMLPAPLSWQFQNNPISKSVNFKISQFQREKFLALPSFVTWLWDNSRSRNQFLQRQFFTIHPYKLRIFFVLFSTILILLFICCEQIQLHAIVSLEGAVPWFSNVQYLFQLWTSSQAR